MGLLDIFRSKGTLVGDLALSDLPECKMLSVTVHLFAARSASDPLPYEGNPPPPAYRNEISVREAHDPIHKPLRFSVKKTAGFYHIDVGVIAYREANGRMYAQVEHFFPFERPCEITAGQTRAVQLRVRWPAIPLEELGVYGTIHPQGMAPDA